MDLVSYEVMEAKAIPEIMDDFKEGLIVTFINFNGDCRIVDIRGKPERRTFMKKTNSKYIVVKKSKIHNNGIFAKKDVPKGIKVLQYVGEKIDKTEGAKREVLQDKLAAKTKIRSCLCL